MSLIHTPSWWALMRSTTWRSCRGMWRSWRRARRMGCPVY